MQPQPELQVDPNLLKPLEHAEPADVKTLVALITDGGSGRLALSTSVRIALTDACSHETLLDAELRLLIRELQLFGGNSFKNLTRGDGPAYAQIVSDVLERVDESSTAGKTVEQMELSVLESLIARMWSTRDHAERLKLENWLGLNPSGTGFDLDAVRRAIREGGQGAINAAMLLMATFRNAIG